MADTLRDIGAQMANVMSNLAQRPGDALTGDHVATMDSLRKQWDAAVRATPPSPSTAPEGCAWLPLEPTEAMVHAAEDLPAPRMFGKVWRAMAGAALASRPAEVDDAGAGPGGQMAVEQAETRMDAGSQPVVEVAQEVDDEGLPPLPPEAARASKGEGQFYMKWSETGKDLRGELLLFTAEQYRQGQRDAVAAYKKKQAALQELADQAQENGMGYGAAPSQTTNKENG
ncbi:hypothetical protein [Massilia oculi]|uniref:hypothetical protein n=1 Tax=Massilia oculi TaxID=945844 RepID=UPI001AAE311D|nr:hypothetical protein [Massilia oculi]